MKSHHYAAVQIVRAHPDVQDVGAFVIGGNRAFLFTRMKPRAQRQHSVDEIIADLRPKISSVPGIFVFMQNPPPITVSGQYAASAYQLTLQSTNLKEIYEWSPRLMGRTRARAAAPVTRRCPTAAEMSRRWTQRFSTRPVSTTSTSSNAPTVTPRACRRNPNSGLTFDS